jgi:hypothetical protein
LEPYDARQIQYRRRVGNDDQSRSVRLRVRRSSRNSCTP